VQGAVGGAANGTLPFTGLDVLFLFAGGAVLLAVGMGLRLVSRARN
jgi:cell division protein FtsW (lipid II flippase)